MNGRREVNLITNQEECQQKFDEMRAGKIRALYGRCVGEKLFAESLPNLLFCLTL